MGILDTILRLLGTFSLYMPRRLQAIASESNQTLTDINSEYLCQHWFNSYEEEQGMERRTIYRPKYFRESWVSRFRMQYIFHKNGDCEWLCLDPLDRHYFESGKWRVEPSDKGILQIVTGETTVSYRVTELKKDILRLAWIKPNA